MAEINPDEHTVDGQSFYNPALVGSGTILPDGTYGDPLPDPTVQRGGVTDGRTTSGGVKRPDPAELTAPAQRTELESKPAPKRTAK